MNLQSKYPTTPDEFLRWNEGREGKREFVNGKVVEMMINVTRNHVRIATNLLVAIATGLDRDAYTVGSADFGVRTVDGIRYPDVFVDKIDSSSRGSDLAASQPIFLAEVLSPSSYGRDFVEKLKDYQSIEPLLYYMILSHEEPRVWLASRVSESWTAVVEIAGLDQTISFPDMNLTLELQDIYDGVELRQTQ